MDQEDLGESPELQRVKEKAKDLRDDVNELTAETIVALRKSIEQLSAVLAANALEARNRGYSELNNLKEAIRRSPLQSVALATGCGLIIGLWRRRSFDGRRA